MARVGVINSVGSGAEQEINCYDCSTSEHGDATSDCACHRQVAVGIYDFARNRANLYIYNRSS